MNFKIEISKSGEIWTASALGLIAGGSTVKEALDIWASMIVDRAITEIEKQKFR